MVYLKNSNIKNLQLLSAMGFSYIRYLRGTPWQAFLHQPHGMLDTIIRDLKYVCLYLKVVSHGNDLHREPERQRACPFERFTGPQSRDKGQ